MNRLKLRATLLLLSSTLILSTVSAATRYVATTGTDSGACSNQSSPCRTIVYGISQMAGGDTLIVGNGTYTEPNAIRNVPNGNRGPDNTPRTPDDVYTTVRAETDFGVLIDGSNWPDNWVCGIRLDNKSFIKVQGFKIFSSQTKPTNGPMGVIGSDHIKIIRNAFAYGPITDNAANAGFGPDCDYVLMEENYAFGGSRYQFLNYWTNHAVYRRNVARNDYWTGSLQSAAFTNYDSVNTVWQNNIAIDSALACCTGHSPLYAAFFNENKTDHAPDTSQEFHGNIVLNYKTTYGAHMDYLVTGTRIMSNNIYWDSHGGYWGEQGSEMAASFPSVYNITSGAMTGSYDASNGQPASGVGMSIQTNRPNTVRNSIFANNRSFGVADYVNGNYNAFSGNGANYGGNHSPTPGANDITNHNIIYNASTNPNGSMKYLPRGAENGSVLATAGEGGGRVGAQVLWKIGVDGTLYGEPGWNVERSPENGYGGAADKLWPFPNEAVIKADMAAYNLGGLSGPRGFAAPGNGLYGGPRTLTSYIWEYLGNACPADICVGGSPVPPNLPPTVVTPAAATPNTVTATTVALSVLGADDSGEPALTYTWSTTGTPPAVPTYSVNGTNAAKNTTATFTRAGSYTFRVTIRDAGFASVTSDVIVNVNQTLTSITVSPASVSVQINNTRQFTASGRDQFNVTMNPQPSFTWGVPLNAGTINASGLFAAGSTAGGPYTVTAQSGARSGTASVTVTVTPPTNTAPVVNAGVDLTVNYPNGVTLSGIVSDDGLPNPPDAFTVTWIKVSGPGNVAFGNASGIDTTAFFSAVGTYVLRLTANDSQLSAFDDMTVTVQGSDGSPNPVSPTTNDRMVALPNQPAQIDCPNTCQVTVFNQLGAEVFHTSGAGNVLISNNDLASGTYQARIKSDGSQRIRKLVIVK